MDVRRVQNLIIVPVIIIISILELGSYIPEEGKILKKSKSGADTNPCGQTTKKNRRAKHRVKALDGD